MATAHVRPQSRKTEKPEKVEVKYGRGTLMSV